MANKMLSNIQSLTTGVSTLTQKVNELYAAVEKVSEVAQGAVSGVQGVMKNGGGYHHLNTASNRPGTGADGARFPAGAGAMPTYQNIEQSMGTFGGTPAAQTRGSGGNNLMQTAAFAKMAGVNIPGLGGTAIAAGVGQAAFGLAAGAYAATPDLNMTLSRSLGYYQAGLKMPGISRGQLERATFGAMAGGLSSVGSDALVAAILAGRGVSPGGSNYMRLTGEVGGAYKYLGMENAPAAQALSELRAGPMAANMYQYGITMYDQKGQMRSTGDIARQLMNVMTGGRGFSSVEAFNESLLRGALGANMSNMGFSAAQQEILVQSMRDQVAGRSGDLATSKPVGDNPNTMLTAQGRLNASQTELMMRGEESIIKGFENAADTVEAFNRALLNVIEPLGYLKGLLGGVGGTNVGQGIATAAPSVLSGLKKIAGGALVLGGVLTAPSGIGIGLAATGAALLASGGGNPGFGSGFNTGMGARGGGNVTAGYGSKDNSGIWSSTGGVHKGTDFAMPIGSPVAATLGGTVSSIDAGADYGTSVVIDHGGGLQTVYGHLSQREVKLGDKVAAGQRIGKSGDTGNTTGPHLHYEVRQGKNNPVDPSVLSSVGGLNPSDLYSQSGSQGLAYLFANAKSGAPGASDVVTYKGSKGTQSQKEWATSLLGALGAPASDSNVSALVTWSRFEGGHFANSAKFNPLNTTLDRPGATAMNSVGVKRYLTWEQGLDATVSTLLGNRSKERGYSAIVDALRSDAGTSAVLSAVNQSAWVHGEGKASNYKFPRGAGNTGYGASFSTEATGTSGSKNVYINVKYDRADQAAALKLAKMVESYLKDNATNSAIGGS
jgi:murein DD-endopeptidase MepM/ murein hydrolase activator NlpD